MVVAVTLVVGAAVVAGAAVTAAVVTDQNVYGKEGNRTTWWNGIDDDI